MNKYLLLFFTSLLSFSLLSQSSSDLWGEIRNRMVFDHELNHPSVIYELEKYNDNQYVINRLAKNGQRYLYYTVTESIERNLPVELALLPFIESQFDPYAQSSTGASGIWQFILSTAREQNLKKIGGTTGEETLLHQRMLHLITLQNFSTNMMTGYLLLQLTMPAPTEF